MRRPRHRPLPRRGEATASRAMSRRRRGRPGRCAPHARPGRRAGAPRRCGRARVSAPPAARPRRGRRAGPGRGSGGGERPPRCGGEGRELGNGGFDRGDLTEIDEARHRADRPCEERRPRARRAQDEDEAVVEPPEPLAERCAAPRGEPLRHAELVQRRFEESGHRAILAAASRPGQPSTRRPCSGPRRRPERRDTCGRRTSRWVSGSPDCCRSSCSALIGFQ